MRTAKRGKEVSKVIKRQLLVLLGIVLVASNCLARGLKVDYKFEKQSTGYFHYVGVEGVVINEGPETVRSATVKVKFYGRGRTVLATKSEYIWDLEVYERWPFKLYEVFFGDENPVVDYKLWIEE